MGRGCSWTVRLCMRGTSSDEEREEEGGWFITKGGMERVREGEHNTTKDQWQTVINKTWCNQLLTRILSI